jgi:hypothetical protein
MWIAGYHDLSAAKPGLYGSVVARGEAHTLRLALIYALLDECLQIEPSHLRAALALWRYCEASTRFIFGDALGDPVADEILRSLRRAGADGMTRSDISNLFGRQKANGIGLSGRCNSSHNLASESVKCFDAHLRPGWLAAIALLLRLPVLRATFELGFALGPGRVQFVPATLLWSVVGHVTSLQRIRCASLRAMSSAMRSSSSRGT